MKTIRINQLPTKNFSGEEISNAVFVKFENGMQQYPLYSVSFEQVFAWIKERALKEGLTVELKTDKIIFINGNGLKH